MTKQEEENIILSHMTEQIEEEKIVLSEEEFVSQEDDVNKSQVLDPIASKVAKREDVSQDTINNAGDHQQNKRVKTDFDYCMEQVQYWMTKAAEIHPQKVQDCHRPNNQPQTWVQVCSVCRDLGHFKDDCSFLNFPCIGKNGKDCPFTMQMLTSGRPWSMGRKFLTCNICDAFLWKEDAEKWIIKENAKKFEKGHGTLKLTINKEVPIVIEGNAEDVTNCALKLSHGYACSKQTD